MHFIDTANVTLDMPYFSTLCKGRVKVDFSHLSVISVSNLSAGWCVKLSYCVILAASFTTTNDMGVALEFGGGGVCVLLGFVGFEGFFGCCFWGFFVNGSLVSYFRKIIYPRLLQDNAETSGNVCSFKLI